MSIFLTFLKQKAHSKMVSKRIGVEIEILRRFKNHHGKCWLSMIADSKTAENNRGKPQRTIFENDFCSNVTLTIITPFL